VKESFTLKSQKNITFLQRINTFFETNVVKKLLFLRHKEILSKLQIKVEPKFPIGNSTGQKPAQKLSPTGKEFPKLLGANFCFLKFACPKA